MSARMVSPDNPLVRLVADRHRRFHAKIEARALALQRSVGALPPPRRGIARVLALPAPVVPAAISAPLMEAVAAFPPEHRELAKQVAVALLAHAFGARPAASVFAVSPSDVTAAAQAAMQAIEPVAYPAPRRFGRRELIEIAARKFGLTPADLVSDRRARHLVHARQTACFLMKRFTGSSYPAMGRALGDRDHTTALHAVRKVEAEILRAGIDGGDDPEAWALALAARSGSWGGGRCSSPAMTAPGSSPSRGRIAGARSPRGSSAGSSGRGSFSVRDAGR